MNTRAHITKKRAGFITSVFSKTDPLLLLFLILFLDVKVIVKVAAVIFAYIARPDFKFGFAFKASRLPLFYPLIIVIALFNAFAYHLFTNTKYDLVLLTGIFFWLLCILAIHQIKLTVERTNIEVIHQTLLFFFLLNAFISFINLFIIIAKTGEFNPYLYQGLHQKYFIGTGDYIRGIFFDTSTTNAIINAFAVIYFIKKNKFLPALICMAVVLLTGSNLTNIMLAGVFLFLFIFKSTKDQKSIIAIGFCMLILFLVKISPQNNQYSQEIFKKIFKQPEVNKPVVTAIQIIPQQKDPTTIEEKKQQAARAHLDSVSASIYQASKKSQAKPLAPTTVPLSEKPFIPKPNINGPEYQSNKDTTATQKELITFSQNHHEDSLLAALKNQSTHLPGKIVALQQTVRFFKDHPSKIITGAGLGNFSSKIAFRATALQVSGGYPQRYAYISDAFRENHLAVFLYYFSMDTGNHSVLNTPDSTTGQLFSEYGLLGLCVFLIFYIGFFVKHFKKLSYGIPLLLIMCGSFFIGYWFEQLSVIVLFELLMLLDMKEEKVNPVQHA